jgi:hypothetical protein
MVRVTAISGAGIMTMDSRVGVYGVSRFGAPGISIGIEDDGW